MKLQSHSSLHRVVQHSCHYTGVLEYTGEGVKAPSLFLFTYSSILLFTLYFPLQRHCKCSAIMSPSGSVNDFWKQSSFSSAHIWQQLRPLVSAAQSRLQCSSAAARWDAAGHLPSAGAINAHHTNSIEFTLFLFVCQKSVLVNEEFRVGSFV